jgi:hypothetical protein
VKTVTRYLDIRRNDKNDGSTSRDRLDHFARPISSGETRKLNTDMTLASMEGDRPHSCSNVLVGEEVWAAVAAVAVDCYLQATVDGSLRLVWMSLPSATSNWVRAIPPSTAARS